MSEPATAIARRGSRGRGFTFWLGVIVAAGLALRIAYVVWYDGTHLGPGGDAFYYHWQARGIAKGWWFIEPYQWKCRQRHVPSAAHPPLYTLLLAVPSFLGGTSTLVHRLVTTLPGAATVLLAGLVGRDLRGTRERRDERTGLIAAGVAAAYPALWINDALLMSETLFAATVALLIWRAYRYRNDPVPRQAAWLGVALALTVLARAEAALFALVLVAPLVLTRRLPWAGRLRHLGAAALAALAVTGPWIGFNLARFDESVTVSTGLGSVLSVANCDEVYEGDRLGLWSVACAIRIDNLAAGRPADERPVLVAPKVGSQLCVGFRDGLERALGDESEQERIRRRESLEYVGDHLDRVVPVVAARLGRTFEVYDPGLTIRYSDFVENRGKWASRLGQWTWYVLGLAGVAGLLLGRRLGVPVWPLASAWVVVVVTTAVTYGNVRFRIPLDVTLPVLAAALSHRLKPDASETGHPASDG